VKVRVRILPKEVSFVFIVYLLLMVCRILSSFTNKDREELLLIINRVTGLLRKRSTAREKT
jgi:hypothetical protein